MFTSLLETELGEIFRYLRVKHPTPSTRRNYECITCWPLCGGAVSLQETNSGWLCAGGCKPSSEGGSEKLLK